MFEPLRPVPRTASTCPSTVRRSRCGSAGALVAGGAQRDDGGRRAASTHRILREGAMGGPGGGLRKAVDVKPGRRSERPQRLDLYRVQSRVSHPTRRRRGARVAAQLASSPCMRGGVLARSPRPRSRPGAGRNRRRGRTRAATSATPPSTARGCGSGTSPSSEGGSIGAIIARAKRNDIGTVYIKAADGGGAWSQFSTALVQALHRGGLDVCAWQFVYGDAPAAEAKAAAAAVKKGPTAS